MNPLWLLRIKHLIQHPPSPQRIALIAAVLAICAVIVGVETIWGWPAWLTVNRIRP